MSRARDACAGARWVVKAAARFTLAVSLLGTPPAVAETADGQEEPAPPVDLDSLLRLPPDVPPPSGPPAGALDKEHWEERFASAREDLRQAEESVEQAQRELEAIASKSESWQMAAPGAQATTENSPLSYKLRQEIRRRREEVDRAKQRLQELETEASLAGVPEEWRQPPPPHEDAVPEGPQR